MKGDNELEEDVEVDQSDFASMQIVSGNDRYNVRYFQVHISNLPSLFYVFAPNYLKRNEQLPTFEFFQDHFEITYSYIPRKSTDICNLLTKFKLVEQGYEIAVTAAVEKSSWMQAEDCVITVQYPFPVENRKQVETDSWYVFCFHEKREQGNIKCQIADLDF